MRYGLIFALFFLSMQAQARVCTINDIREIDTRREASNYTPFPVMTRTSLASNLLPLFVHMESSESSTYWTVNFAGIAGAVYLAVQSFDSVECVDDRDGTRFYRPSFEELLKYHNKEKDFFWKSYSWSGLWMLGVALTAESSEKKSAAFVAMALPWAFAFSKRWSALSADSELQFSIRPFYDGNQTGWASVMHFNF